MTESERKYCAERISSYRTTVMDRVDNVRKCARLIRKLGEWEAELNK